MDQTVLQNAAAHNLDNDAGLQVLILVAPLHRNAIGGHDALEKSKPPLKGNEERAHPQDW